MSDTTTGSSSENHTLNSRSTNLRWVKRSRGTGIGKGVRRGIGLTPGGGGGETRVVKGRREKEPTRSVGFGYRRSCGGKDWCVGRRGPSCLVGGW